MGRRQRRRDKLRKGKVTLSTAYGDQSTAEHAEWLASLADYPEAPEAPVPANIRTADVVYPVCDKCQRKHDPWLPDCPA